MNKIYNPILKLIDKEYWLRYWTEEKPKEGNYVNSDNKKQEYLRWDYVIHLRIWERSFQEVKIHPSQVEAFTNLAKQSRYYENNIKSDNGVFLPSDSNIEIRTESKPHKECILCDCKTLYAFLSTSKINYMHVEGTKILPSTTTTNCPTCGSEVFVESADEGTSFYAPLDTQKWISVKDRLPHIGEPVLVFEAADSIHVSFYNGEKPKGKKGEYHYEWPDGQDEQPSGYFVTHWMQLPSPPNKE